LIRRLFGDLGTIAILTLAFGVILVVIGLAGSVVWVLLNQ
jgi:hypothetical protein